MIVEIKNLIKRYGSKIAIDNINLSIKEGDIYGLLGPNGAGKTTLINTMLCLTKISDGQIKVFGKDVNTHEDEIKKDIGIVPQEIAIYYDLTAYENLQFFGRLYGLKGNLLKERIEETLEFIGLKDNGKDYPQHFSGGMRRRLNIGCAILHQPKLIIMDEPTVGIDPQSRKQILESVKTLNKRGSTIIYTSHYMEEVEALCRTITILDHGRVMGSGTKEELKNLISSEDQITLKLSNINQHLCEAVRELTSVKDCILEENSITVISNKDSKNLGKIIVITLWGTELRLKVSILFYIIGALILQNAIISREVIFVLLIAICYIIREKYIDNNYLLIIEFNIILMAGHANTRFFLLLTILGYDLVYKKYYIALLPLIVIGFMGLNTEDILLLVYYYLSVVYLLTLIEVSKLKKKKQKMPLIKREEHDIS